MYKMNIIAFIWKTPISRSRISENDATEWKKLVETS